MSLLPESELQAVEAWFADLKEALGVSQNADRGRVLASVRKLITDNDSYDQEKRVVAAACGYKRWGDLYTWANEKLVATPEVELPEVFSKPPNGVVFRPGGDYDKAEKRLVKTRLRLKEVWAYIEKELATDPSCGEWAEEQKTFFVEEFEATTEFEEFDQSCLAFVRNYEEENPAATWGKVAKEAEAALERNYDLPLGVVTELVCYAEETGVEATKKVVEVTRNNLNPAGDWFDHLLTAYLYQNSRPEEAQVFKVGKLFLEATELGKCFEVVSANDPDRPTFTKRSYNQNLTLVQVAAAVRKLTELKQTDLNGTRDEWEQAVTEAVEAAGSKQEVTATA